MWHSSSVVYIESATVNTSNFLGLATLLLLWINLKVAPGTNIFILIDKDDDTASTWDIAHLHCGVFYRMWMFQVASMRKGVARIKGIPYVRIIMRNEKTSAKLLKPPDRDKLFGKGISFLAAELGLGPRHRCSSPHTFPHSTSHGCCSAAGCRLQCWWHF